jgi:hypothetical protein
MGFTVYCHVGIMHYAFDSSNGTSVSDSKSLGFVNVYKALEGSHHVGFKNTFAT